MVSETVRIAVKTAKEQLTRQENVPAFLEANREYLKTLKVRLSLCIAEILEQQRFEDSDSITNTSSIVTEETEGRSGRIPTGARRQFVSAAFLGRQSPPMRVQVETMTVYEKLQHAPAVQLRILLEARPVQFANRTIYQRLLLRLAALLELRAEDISLHTTPKGFDVGKIEFHIDVLQIGADGVARVPLETDQGIEHALLQYRNILKETATLMFGEYEDPVDLERQRALNETLTDQPDKLTVPMFPFAYYQASLVRDDEVITNSDTVTKAVILDGDNPFISRVYRVQPSNSKTRRIWRKR